jgi:hypothetical protein
MQKQQAADPLLELFRRQTNECQIGFYGCTNYGVPTACCSSTASCTTDANNDIACCPSGASCTGTLGAAVSSTSGLLLGTATTTGNSLLPASTANFVQSTVANQYFPFLYIPTTFANAAACSSYFTSCQAEYTSCLTSLGGVAVVATTTAASNIQLTARQAPTGTAQSICSSLYSQGCYNLEEGYCSSLSGGAAATGSGIIITGNGAERTIGVGRWSMGAVGVVMGMVVLAQL